MFQSSNKGNGLACVPVQGLSKLTMYVWPSQAADYDNRRSQKTEENELKRKKSNRISAGMLAILSEFFQMTSRENFANCHRHQSEF